MSDLDSQIHSILNRPFIPIEKDIRPCWEFCRDVMQWFDYALPADPRTLSLVDSYPPIPSIVLFAGAGDWHAGIVWPDGLHFIHARPESPTSWFVRKDRLTLEPWKLLIKGYYVVS